MTKLGATKWDKHESTKKPLGDGDKQTIAEYYEAGLKTGKRSDDLLTELEERYGRSCRQILRYVSKARESRKPYQETPHNGVSASTPQFQKHASDVLSLLDTYVSQLEVSYEPENFVTPSEGAPPTEEEYAFWFFAKKAVPSLETLIDSQIDSESLTLAPVLERQPEFEALTGHYEGTKLWQQIVTYKQEGGKYVSIGAKLHRIIISLVRSLFKEETEVRAFRSALTELIREDLAPVRVKLHLEGIETDRAAISSRLPDADFTSLQQGVELLQRYLNDRSEAQETQKLFAELHNLLARITEAYQCLKAKQRDILRGLKEEKFKGQLPAGSKCKFCPTT